VRRAVRRFAASRPGAWVLARVLYHLDRSVLPITGRHHTLSNQISGLPVVMLTTTGARSGRPRTVPVLGLSAPDGAIAVAAANFGQRRHPGWPERRAAG
jgi:hypothetical protein